MALASGTKLGPYEIQSALGADGMGEVYRAKDTRLDRAVAIKVLPESVANDTDRLRRFQQEAKTVAALSHPNIMAIHDIGTHDGSPFLVSEFLEGETLRQKIEAGPLPQRRVIDYALGIALGLAAAHDKGVFHRDLKPENIFITRDERVKILDFGLAKLVRPEEGQTEVTLTTPATLPGMVMGTVGYMSPEQVKGKPSDARSDIFSFGAVLYEMLTGKRAFKRDTSAETMTAILREEPPELSDTGWQGPLALQRILRRCLEKGPERRFQSASDLAFAIEALSGTSSSSTIAPQAISSLPKSKFRRRAAWITAAAILAVAAIAFVSGVKFATEPPPVFKQLAFGPGYVSSARFTPDGANVVYGASWNGKPLQIFSTRLDGVESRGLGLPPADV